LPDAYRRWRARRLGQITDGLEEDLILELIGSPVGRRILDAGCGDGVLAAPRRAVARLSPGSTAIRARCPPAGRERNKHAVEFVEGDIRALPFCRRDI
jgi:SAM-dependent methyltransferase